MGSPIRDLLLRAVSGQPTQRDVEDLVERLAAVLLPLAARRSFPGIRQEGYKPLDVALITIGGLLVRDERNTFPILETAFGGRGKWLEQISEPDLSRYLRAVLDRRLRETLFLLAREAWPERAKIRRELLYALKKDPRLTVHRDERGVFFCRGRKASAGPPVPFARVLESVQSGGARGLRLPAFLARLLNGLDREESCRPILVSDAVRAFEEANVWDGPEPAVTVPARGDAFGRDAEELQARVRRWILDLALENRAAVASYVRKRRISERDAAAVVQALSDYVEEWLEGGPERSLFELLRARGFSIGAAAYRKKHRAIYEYLALKSRRFIQDQARRWRDSAKKDFAAINDMGEADDQTIRPKR